MAIYHIYTDDSGESRIRPMSVETDPDLALPRPASGFFLKEFPAGTVLDWHPAPRRQAVVVVSGELELAFTDGSVHRFTPGDVRIIEDTTGKGYRTRVVGGEPCLLAVTALAS